MDEEVKEFFANLSADASPPEAQLARVASDVSAASIATSSAKRTATRKEEDEIEEVEAAVEEEDEKEEVNEEAEEGEDDLSEEGEGQLTVDVYQTSDEIVVQSTIAGVDPDDLEVAINNEMVTVRGKRKRAEEVRSNDYFVQELYWGAFSRSVILPQEIDSDKAVAELKNGILTVRLPKIKKQRVKKLKIKTA